MSDETRELATLGMKWLKYQEDKEAIEKELLLSFLDYCRHSLGSVLIDNAGTYYWEELGAESAVSGYLGKKESEHSER